MRGTKLLEEFIREEIGRNYHTVNNDPVTWDSFADYDIEGYMTQGGEYNICVTYKKGDPKHEDVILRPTSFRDEPEARNRARMVVDSHRVRTMNTAG